MPLMPFAIVAVTALSTSSTLAPAQATNRDSVAKLVTSQLPKLGPRNWVVVVDAAYPLQTSPGIEMVTVNVDHIAPVSGTLAAISKAKHVRPTIYLDQELKFVPESRTPGIGKFRNSLNGVLKGKPVTPLLHSEIIAKLEEAGKSFKVMVIKTPHVQPYTSVFFQLECGYWSDAAEKELRKAMSNGS
jgi:hypothetical protein